MRQHLHALFSGTGARREEPSAPRPKRPMQPAFLTRSAPPARAIFPNRPERVRVPAGVPADGRFETITANSAPARGSRTPRRRITGKNEHVGWFFTLRSRLATNRRASTAHLPCSGPSAAGMNLARLDRPRRGVRNAQPGRSPSPGSCGVPAGHSRGPRPSPAGRLPPSPPPPLRQGPRSRGRPRAPGPDRWRG